VIEKAAFNRLNKRTPQATKQFSGVEFNLPFKGDFNLLVGVEILVYHLTHKLFSIKSFPLQIDLYF
jgi:hypothetical protein